MGGLGHLPEMFYQFVDFIFDLINVITGSLGRVSLVFRISTWVQTLGTLQNTVKMQIKV